MVFGNRINLGLLVLLTTIALTAAAPIAPADEVTKINTSEHLLKKSRRKVKKVVKKDKKTVKKVKKTFDAIKKPKTCPRGAIC